MVIGCLGHLAAIAGLSFALERAFGDDIAEPLRPWASVLASSLITLGASNFLHLIRGYGQGDQSRDAILARAATGTPPVEGGPMMVTGVARPESGTPFVSPLTGTPCVAYEYRLYRRHKLSFGQRRGITVMWLGLATQPFVVESGGRSVRVLALPDLVDVRKDMPRPPEVRANAQAWVGATRFQPFSVSTLPSIFSAMTAAHVEPQPRGVRLDWGREGATAPASLQMDEGLVPVGQEVSVVGHWSPELQAIVPGPGGLAATRVTVALGPPSELSWRATALPSSVAAVAIFGVLLLGAGGAIIWAMDAGLLAAIPAAFR
ncbi:hypothetical protein TBR22_A13850 [Luteitalea sp. TBR-22]|uniref:hypothetical protein n=1 Tax=Luteitalea sp. TBR-22 TaxID=2802971 RepID=UPI001AF719BF|nr:hypothetical protein [Luteitalea sp. TBR-22]BCS32175.1 hypothetical protein TBR22_A13850 [Luteitalea sp. TBR-22]